MSTLDTIFNEICNEYPNDIGAIKKRLKGMGLTVNDKEVYSAYLFLIKHDFAEPIENTIGGDYGMIATSHAISIYKPKSLGSGISFSLSSHLSKSQKKAALTKQYKLIERIITLVMSMIGGIYALIQIFSQTNC